MREVIQAFKDKGEVFDEIMLLQVTSPLRIVEDIYDSINLFQEKKANAVVSVTKCDHSPLWCNTLPEDLSMDEFERSDVKNRPRQAFPTYYRFNGAIYLLKTSELYTEEMFAHGCYAYIMPQNRSIDIDTELDFMIAETIMTNKHLI